MSSHIEVEIITSAAPDPADATALWWTEHSGRPEAEDEMQAVLDTIFFGSLADDRVPADMQKFAREVMGLDATNTRPGIKLLAHGAITAYCRSELDEGRTPWLRTDYEPIKDLALLFAGAGYEGLSLPIKSQTQTHPDFVIAGQFTTGLRCIWGDVQAAEQHAHATPGNGLSGSYLNA